MNAAMLLAVVAILVALGAWIVLAWVRSRAEARSESQINAFRQEMQGLVSSQMQAIVGQLGQLTQSVNQQLGQVRQELQNGVAATGQLASTAQQNVAQQLESATRAVREVSERISVVEKAGADLSQTTQTLQQVLGGAKSRGTLGEITLERMLEDALPQEAFETQYRFSTGNIVDAVVHLGDHLVSVDSKFPLDSYRRLIDSGDDARKEFAQAVRKHTDAIAEKYILPAEHTLDYALMFVPSEAVYYELLMTEDAKNGALDEYCRGKRVFPVSPNTFYASLRAIAISLQGQQFAENAKHLMASLGGLKKQIETFAEVYEKLGTHLRHAQQSYEDADSKLGRARNALEQMAQGALPEAPPKALEASTKE
jgi:DNA recombination protein RmuC